MIRQWAQFGSPGVCHVPGLAFVASCQQAIREFRVRLMELKQTPASWAAEVQNGLRGFGAMVLGANSIQWYASS